MSAEPPTIDVANSERPLFLGFDVGGTSIKLGVVDDRGRPLAATKIVTEEERGPRDAVKRARTAVEDMLKAKGLALTDLAGVGLCVPGRWTFPKACSCSRIISRIGIIFTFAIASRRRSVCRPLLPMMRTRRRTASS